MKMHRFLLLVFLILGVSCAKSKEKSIRDDNSKVVLAYVTPSSKVMPDVNLVTHINYAFGHVNKTFDGISIANEDFLRKVVALKEKKPELKVLISIGGWTSGGFSEMASTDERRKAFAADCKRVVDQFGLDGIDMDWEYPSSSEAGISSSPNDVDNFTLLMKDIRAAIGENKMLTLATIASAKFIDFKAIEPYVDLVNVMAYDVARPPHHHSGLYRSSHSGKITSAEAVEAHIDSGVPLRKLVLGIPFYGHGVDSIPDFIDYKDIVNLTGYEKQWDDTAKIPYMTNAEGKFVLCYEDTASIAIKCNYILNKGLRGAMYWEHACDDANQSLSKAVFKGIYK